MKKLPEHSPKPETWKRILNRVGFDSQLETLLPNLPQYQPKDFVWGRITTELDRKKTTPAWVPWGIAAAVVLFLFLTGVNPEWMGKGTQDLSPLASSQDDAPKTDIPIPTENKAQAAEIAIKLPDNQLKDSPKSKPVPRTMVTIEVPKLALPEWKPVQTDNLSLEIQEAHIPEPSPPKTMHHVSVSWTKTKPGLQVKTTFGRKEAELDLKPQASVDPAGQLVLEINN